MTTPIRRFTLSDSFIDSYRDKEVPWGPLGYVVYKDRYARRFSDYMPGVEGTEEWVDTCRRVVEGTFSMQKKHVVSLGTAWDNAKAQRTAKDMFDRLFNLKWTPPGRGLWMMGLPYVEERSGAALFNCFKGDTPVFIYKDDNIVLETLENIGEGTEVQIPILDNGKCIPARATCKSFGNQDLYEIVFRHNWGKSNYRFSYSATKDHSWILSNGTRTTSLKVNDIVSVQPLKAPMDCESFNEGFVHGIVFGDGCQNNKYKNRYMIRLCSDRDKEQLERLESTKDYRSTVYCKSNNGDPLLTFVTNRNLKQVPLNTDPSYLRGFLEGWLCADAWQKPNGAYCLDSQSPEAAEWLKKFAPFAGYTIRGITQNNRPTNFGDRSAPLNRITLVPESSTYKVESINKIERDKVWCLTVDNYSRFTLAGGLVTGNCAFRSTKDIATQGGYIFGWIMDALMLGVGVGFDTKGAGSITIKGTRFADNSYSISDDREGWVESVKLLIDGFFTGRPVPQFDYSLIREHGEPIKGFGGTASGAGPLKELHMEIAILLGNRVNEPITSTDIVRISNLIGKCVVAGNVRRSAELAMGDPLDEEFLSMKDPTVNANWNTYAQWASNNSPVVSVGQNYASLAKRSAMNGEPGYIWLENARNFGRMADAPREDDHMVMGFNPCFAGDTLIAVADGRGAVTIEELALQGKDVPVYAMDPDTGQVEIKMGRNPRITGLDQTLVEVTLDDNSIIRVTPNHKFYLRDGTVKEAKDLQPNDSLPRFDRKLTPISKKDEKSRYLMLNLDTRNPRNKRVFEHRLIAKYHYPDLWEKLYDENKQIGWIKGGLVIHHKDYNKLNNSPDNLELMTWSEHASLHAKDNSGELNPMFGKQHKESTKQLIGKSSLQRWQDEDFIQKQSDSWTEERKHNASKVMSDIKNRMDLEYYLEQEKQTDLSTLWIDNRLHAKKQCEVCNNSFIVTWGKRGQACCSIACSNKQHDAIEARKAGQQIAFESKQQQTLEKQIQLYKDLQFELDRLPMKKEWENKCREENVSFRIRHNTNTDNPYVLTSYRQLQQLASEINHRVLSVKFLTEKATVYNISVDDFHTVGVITTYNSDTGVSSGIFMANCVEQQLEDGELCCLCETYPARHDSYEDYLKTLKIAYLYGKTVTLANTHWPETNAVMLKNRRIGTSISGIWQAFAKFGRREFFNWCDNAYKQLQIWDRVYSDWLCVPRSKRMTSVKPSGTVSKLVGATAGAHLAQDQYWLCRIRFDNDSPMFKALTEAGYPSEKLAYGSEETRATTSVVEIPVKEEYFERGVRDVSMWEQLEIAAQLQHYWADNSVSITVTFKPEEAKDIQYALELYETRLKAVSFLPYFDASNTSYVQMPNEPISKEQYEERIKHLLPITKVNTIEGGTGEKFCTNDTCELTY